jgi:Putative peptidoglycan binding domain
MIVMKKLTSLLIGCSLALAGAALAQQPVEQQSPSKGKRAPEKAPPTQAQPGAKAAKPQERPAQQTGAMKGRGATNERSATNLPGADRSQKTHAGHEPANAPKTNVPGKSTDQATKEPKAGKGRKAGAHEESANAPATGTDASGHAAGMPTQKGKDQQTHERKPGQGVKEPAAAKTAASPAAPAGAAASPAPAVSGVGQQNVQAKPGAKAKKPDPQKVQQVKSQHANFRAQPKPQQVQPVTFNQNHRIEGSDRWQGHQYEVFRSYRPEWHDAGWYHSRYPNVTLIAGGYYFFNAGYWYPAWGYNASAQYYAYDGPIYVGQRAQPPDQVIAQTQALLQEMGYYTGEVDGLLGPLTREALTAYQADNGLTPTAAIDQPTLDSLGLA